MSEKKGQNPPYPMAPPIGNSANPNAPPSYDQAMGHQVVGGTAPPQQQPQPGFLLQSVVDSRFSTKLLSFGIIQPVNNT